MWQHWKLLILFHMLRNVSVKYLYTILLVMLSVNRSMFQPHIVIIAADVGGALLMTNLHIIQKTNY